LRPQAIVSPDLSKILFTLSYIRGRTAEEWAGHLAESYIDEAAQPDWAGFWIILESRFVDRNADKWTRAQLDWLTQGGVIAMDYPSTFLISLRTP
jgi:hypothetical protein